MCHFNCIQWGQALCDIYNVVRNNDICFSLRVMASLYHLQYREVIWAIWIKTLCGTVVLRHILQIICRAISVHLERRSPAVLWGTHVNGRIQDPGWSRMEKHCILERSEGKRHRWCIDPAVKCWTTGNWCQVPQTEAVLCWNVERKTEYNKNINTLARQVNHLRKKKKI